MTADLLPSDENAEAAAVAAAMLDCRAWVAMTPVIDQGSFSRADLGVMWAIVTTMYADGRAVDSITLRAELIARRLLDEVGGVARIAEVLGTLPNGASSHGPAYAAIVADKAKLRGLVTVANRLLSDIGTAAAADPAEIIGRAKAAIDGLSRTGLRRQSLSLAEVMDDVLTSLSTKTQKITTGFASIDAVAGGLEPGELLLIGARPSMGKSTLIRQVWLRSARAGFPTALFSVEESPRKIGRNVLASEANVSNERLRRGEVRQEEIFEPARRLSDVPAFVSETHRTLDEIYAEASRLVAREGIRTVLIDYLQRLEVPGKTPYERASAASLGVSNICKELGVAAVVAAQLNRGPEHREDKRPVLGDLRDSGTIEQDADAILLLHREDYYNIYTEDYIRTNEAELIVAKWRDAVRGDTVRLRTRLEYQTFEDVDNSPFR